MIWFTRIESELSDMTVQCIYCGREYGLDAQYGGLSAHEIKEGCPSGDCPMWDEGVDLTAMDAESTTTSQRFFARLASNDEESWWTVTDRQGFLEDQGDYAQSVTAQAHADRLNVENSKSESE